MKFVTVGRLAALAVAITVMAGVAPLAAQQTPPTGAAAGAGRVAFVDMRKVLAATPGYAQAETTFVKEMAGYRSEFQKLQQTLDSAATQFEQQSTLLSPSAREARRKDLQAQQQRLEQRTQELQQRAGARERELLDPIQTRVVGIIEQVRAAAGFGMVLDISAQGSTVVAADKSLDLSDRVIAQLKTAR